MTDKPILKEPTLEVQAQRVLQNPNASSEAIYQCVEDCIEKAQELEQRFKTEAAKANDPTLTSDGGRAARTASEDARLDAARHRKLEELLRLRWNACLIEKCATAGAMTTSASASSLIKAIYAMPSCPA